MRCELTKELTIILTIKVIAIVLIWYLFFSGDAPAVDPFKILL